MDIVDDVEWDDRMAAELGMQCNQSIRRLSHGLSIGVGVGCEYRPNSMYQLGSSWVRSYR